MSVSTAESQVLLRDKANSAIRTKLMKEIHQHLDSDGLAVTPTKADLDEGSPDEE